MCDTGNQTKNDNRASRSTPSTVDAEPEKPKVCNCAKPCCRNELIKKAKPETATTTES